MSKLNASQTLQTAKADSTNAPSGILQRKCACGTHTVAGDKCDECANKKGVLQRKSSNVSEQLEVPPIVHEVLNSSGQPLDKSTRAFFEPRFAHNFSTVPVSPAPPRLSQNSLAIGKPTDAYEQEADHIADSIMLKEKPENKTLSMSEQQGGKFDLSRVRVHTDARAAESAHEINALAYTLGNNIVFGAGQFAPWTHEGQKLIAHELAHVAQQSVTVGKIKRKVNYLQPAKGDIVETEPINTVLNNPRLALTTPKINGQLLPKPVVKNKTLDISGAANIIFPLFSQVYIDRKGGKSTCKVKEPEIDVSAQISILEKPKARVWQGSVPGTRFKKYSTACENVSNVTVYIKGKSGGDAISVYNKVMANEMEHVDDLHKTAKKHFEPFIDFLNKFSQTVSSDKKKEDAECHKAFTAYALNKKSGGGKDAEMIKAFLEELVRLVGTRDKDGGSHDFKPNVQIDGKDCFSVVVKV